MRTRPGARIKRDKSELPGYPMTEMQYQRKKAVEAGKKKRKMYQKKGKK